MEIHSSDKTNKRLREERKTSKDSNIFIKYRKCEQIYNSARYNFNVLEWAIK